MEERAVIEQFLTTRSEEAFCALYEVVCVRIRRYFLLRGMDVVTAEDLTQNVLLKVWRRSGDLRESDRFIGWMFAIARNEMVDWWRDHKTDIETTGLDSLSEEQITTQIIEHEMLSTLRLVELLKALDPSDRDLVVLRFVEGLSYEELADSFGVPLGTIKWRIFNARKKLAQVINPSTRNNEHLRIF